MNAESAAFTDAPERAARASGGDRLRAVLIRTLSSALLNTLAFETRNAAPVEALLRRREPFVFVFWHGSMLWPWWRMRRTGAAALVSMSRDGGLLSALLENWGYTVVRGSSSRGSKEAMASMRALVHEGHVLCVTPDGPRGPCHEMKMGAVRVAQTTGVPLVWATVGYRKFRTLRSWDRFVIPLPFTRAVVEYGTPVMIDPSLEGEALEEKRIELEKAMLAQHRRTLAV